MFKNILENFRCAVVTVSLTSSSETERFSRKKISMQVR